MVFSKDHFIELEDYSRLKVLRALRIFGINNEKIKSCSDIEPVRTVGSETKPKSILHLHACPIHTSSDTQHSPFE